MGEKIIKDFVRSLSEYNPKIKSNSKLRDDYKLFSAYYSSNKAGKEISIAGTKIDLEEIMHLAKLIFDEIENRKAGNTMEYDWNSENMRPAAKEMFDRFVKEPNEEEQVLSDHITEDIVLMEGAVYLSDAKSNEVRLILQDGPLARVFKSKLYKMLPDEIAQKLSITHPVASSNNPVPLFDLVLKRRKVDPNGVQLMSALTPAGTSKIFYNIPDLLEACFI